MSKDSPSIKNKRKRVQLICNEPSRVADYNSQHCDVNRLVENALATGTLNHVKPEPIRFGVFNQNASYHDALNAVIATQKAFMSHPAKVRSKFNNDPAKMIEFVQNPDNYDECLELGLIEKEIKDPSLDDASSSSKSKSEDDKSDSTVTTT